jgi:signal transduction histidine kinase
MGDDELAAGIGVQLLRAVQEALTNVVRHAEATEVRVALDSEAAQVVLQVEDNGRGIRPEALADKKSLGLLGMRERAQFLGGTFEICGGKKKGTSIRVALPKRPEEGGKC